LSQNRFKFLKEFAFHFRINGYKHSLFCRKTAGKMYNVNKTNNLLRSFGYGLSRNRDISQPPRPTKHARIGRGLALLLEKALRGA
jgi:hypothetical protein